MGYDLGSLWAPYVRNPDCKRKSENFMGYSVKALMVVTYVVKEMHPYEAGLIAVSIQ